MASFAPLSFLILVLLAITQIQAQNATDSGDGDDLPANIEVLLQNPEVRDGIAQILLSASSSTSTSESQDSDTPTPSTPTPNPSTPIPTTATPTPSEGGDDAEEGEDITPTPTPTPTPSEGGDDAEEGEDITPTPTPTPKPAIPAPKGLQIQTFLSALQTVNMSGMLSQEMYTVFAPTDSAVEVLLNDLGLTQDEFLQDKKQLREILNNHFVVDTITGFQDGDSYESEAGESLRILKPEENGTISVGTVGSEGQIVKFEFQTDGALIHAVDQVLLPFKKSGQNNLLSAIKSSDRLSTLADVIEAAGLTEIFSDPTIEQTVFAPNNFAFAQILGEDLTAEQLSSVGQEILRDMLYYHVISSGRFDKNQLSDQQELQTLISGEKLTFVNNENGTAIRGSSNRGNIIEFDLYGGKGVIHIIDAVLDYVPSASTDNEQKAQVSVEVSESGVVSVSAPNQEAAQDLGLSVSLTLLDAPAPIPAPAQVVAPPPKLAPELVPVPADDMQSTIQAALDTIINAIDIGGVQIELNSEQGYTIFAPTASAFDAMLASFKAEDIESMSKKMLQDILQQHVVIGSFSSEDLIDGLDLETLKDPSLRVLAKNNNSKIIASTGARANVLIPDLPIEASIVHIIDNVLLPFVPTEQVPVDECNDISPDYRYDCSEQKEFGKCEEPWMIEANYCRSSCGRCGGAVEEAASVADSCDASLVDELRKVVEEKLQEKSNSACRGNELEGILLQMIEQVTNEPPQNNTSR